MIRVTRAWSGGGAPAFLAVVVAVLTSMLLTPPSAGAASSKLRLGIAPTSEFSGVDRDVWLDRVRAESGSMIRVTAPWASVAPSRPPDDRAADPSWAGYRWSVVDDQVRAIVARGLTPLVMINGAPAWAEDAGRPAGMSSAGWKPDAASFGRFAGAVARRYSGTTADPSAPLRALPRATQFQLWNEPNLDLHLAPQWEKGRPFAPSRFRAMVNAGYDAIKAAQPSATVVTAGLAPFGDYGATSGSRTPPVAFLRSMLCLDAKLRRTCRTASRFDALSHHPYGIRAPSSPALNKDDATIPDLGKLTRVLRAARKARTVGPSTPGLWVTEVSYDSSPPDPDGVPASTLARWIPELLWRLWDQGASTVLWFQIRDQAPTPSFAATYQSGLYRNDGARKPYAEAYRFPVLVTGRTSSRLKVWLRSPRAGRVTVQIRRGGRWRKAKTVTARVSQVRSLSVTRSRTTGVRAVVGGETSRAWSVK